MTATTIDRPSTECRLDNHRTCARLQMRCACECHGRTPQMPPTASSNVTVLPQNRKHGVRATYVKGCRCEDCTRAERDYQRERRGLESMSPPRSIEEKRMRDNPIERSPLARPKEERDEARKITPPTVELAWEEPPQPRTGPRASLLERIQPLLEQIRERPGEWARVATWAKASSAGSAQKKVQAALKEFEVVGRKVEGGSALYVRFVAVDGGGDAA